MSATAILCQQCAAALPVEQGTQFVNCEFCGTTNFVDKSGTIQHYVVRDTVAEPDAAAALRRWMAGNQTVKDLDQKSDIQHAVFQLFPMWLVRVQRDNQEMVILEPAAATSITELTELTIPAADLEPYDHGLDETAVDPTVPYDTVKKWLSENQKIAPEQIKEAAIVHLPLYIFKYTFDDEVYTAVVDAASSKVFAGIYPTKWETPYYGIGALGCAIYFCAALIPLAGLLDDGFFDLGTGLLIYLVVAVIFAIPIFAAAAYISSKV